MAASIAAQARIVGGIGAAGSERAMSSYCRFKGSLSGCTLERIDSETYEGE